MSIENRFIIHNDKDLRDSIKEWFCSINKKEDVQIIFFDFEFVNDEKNKFERFSANGFNNLLITICGLKKFHPNVRIYIQLFSNDVLTRITAENQNENIKTGIRNLLIFFESLNLIDMLLNLGVIIRPSDEVLKKLALELNAKKEERKCLYSSKILCLNPLINNSQEQYNLTFRMKTLMNILYWRLKDRNDFREVEEASGQIMFELVKNIYQHSDITPKYLINGFTCAQINYKPLIEFQDEKEEAAYTESVFLSLSQKTEKFILDKKNWGSFISITVNDYGVGIHNKVRELNKQCSSTEEAILYAFTTNFSSKIFESQDEYWDYKEDSEGIKLEHKGFGLLYCLMFVFKNLGRIKICSGNVELELFAKIDTWAEGIICNTPVDFLNLLTGPEGYKKFFHVEIKKLNFDDFVGTQILIEIPTDYMYGRG